MASIIKQDENWISYKRLLRVGLLTLFFVALSFFVFFNLMIGIIAIVITILMILMFVYFIYARYQFSPKGNDVQNKIYNLLLDYITFNGEGKILDIGCGEGTFIVKMAKKYPNAKFTGIDYWENVWGYSKESCIKKAKNEGISNRVIFQKASASKLPFKDETYDLIVSNFVFHEVKDEKDKKQLIKEALRVLKMGGSFVFQDMFLSKYFYGQQNDLLNEIKLWGVRQIELVDTSKSDFIPAGLKLPFITGNMALIYGTK